MTNLVLNSKPYRIIKRKRDNLEEVIYYEGIAQVNDSILNLVNLPEADRIVFFEAIIEKLKTQEAENKQKQEAAGRNTGLITVNNTLNNSNPVAVRGGVPSQASIFYFYNPTIVAYGKNEFIKIWGNRVLEDDWRWSSKAKLNTNKTILDSPVFAEASETELYDPQFYISKIPSEPKTIDSIAKERNFAYYQLGLIYKEKFKENKLAKSKFENVLKNNPEERLILPSKYNLYKIYELLGETDEASIAKNDIISNYPHSRYATILSNPELVAFKDDNSPEKIYEGIYEQQENQEYAEVISKCETYINAFDGEPIVPKLELLKAMATGRLFGLESYSKAINYIAVTYANTPEGEQAQDIETNILPKIQSNQFVIDSVANNFKAVFQFDNTEISEIKTFQDTLNSVLKNIKYYDLTSSLDVYNPNTTFIVVQGLKNRVVAETLNQLFSKEDQKKIKKPYFVISSNNYEIIQIHKNLESYLNLNNK
jgi:outer membrane protein assembly factor BamD (BamD/ComL family)